MLNPCEEPIAKTNNKKAEPELNVPNEELREPSEGVNRVLKPHAPSKHLSKQQQQSGNGLKEQLQ
eukprot:1625374-Ditylum_brightwellii.AAC.1